LAAADKIGRMKIRSALALALVLAPPILLGGCASSSLEPLDLNVVDINVADATLFETSLDVSIRVSNPNPEPLEMEGASFKLVLNDKKVGSGNVAESFTIPRLGSEVVHATFHVNNASALTKLRRILEQETITYGVKGTLWVERGYGTKKIKIDRGGELDLSGVDLTGPGLTGDELTEGVD
jgi:LEA14-like dessication related protein